MWDIITFNSLSWHISYLIKVYYYNLCNVYNLNTSWICVVIYLYFILTCLVHCNFNLSVIHILIITVYNYGLYILYIYYIIQGVSKLQNMLTISYLKEIRSIKTKIITSVVVIILVLTLSYTLKRFYDGSLFNFNVTQLYIVR